MRRLAFLTLTISFVGACVEQDSALDQDDQLIISAVLAEQEDGQEEYEAFLNDYPEQKDLIGKLLDHRLCLARQVAGKRGDFTRPDWTQSEGHTAPSDIGRIWDSSKQRAKIPADLIPDQLRWDSMFRVCPTGVIRLGTPEIDGKRARIFIENRCSGQCGWGGEYHLELSGDEWRVMNEHIWWVA